MSVLAIDNNLNSSCRFILKDGYGMTLLRIIDYTDDHIAVDMGLITEIGGRITAHPIYIRKDLKEKLDAWIKNQPQR